MADRNVCPTNTKASGGRRRLRDFLACRPTGSSGVCDRCREEFVSRLVTAAALGGRVAAAGMVVSAGIVAAAATIEQAAEATAEAAAAAPLTMATAAATI